MSFSRHFALAPALALALAATPSFATAVMTNFSTAHSGFHFDNVFQNYNQLPAGIDFRSGGLCGGMTYAALDYFNAGIASPPQFYVPAEGSPLQSYIYGRQTTSITSNLDKWAELIFNPFGWRDTEFFNWGLQGSAGGRIQELRSFLDRGVPVPLGLKGKNGTGDHQVLAIGYDMGRYAGDLGAFEGDFKIFILNPNFHDQVRTLVPVVSQRYYTEAENPGADTWLTYFVDENYHPQTPPLISAPNYPDDGMIHQLLVQASTGSDDLRGGSDNINLTLNLINGSTITLANINGGAHWISNYTQNVPLTLPTPVHPSAVASLTLADTFSGGLFGDNWDMSQLRVTAVRSQDSWFWATAGFHRFTADPQNRSLLVTPLAPPPAVTPAVGSLLPAGGDRLGGTWVDVWGAHFETDGSTVVHFGGQLATAVDCPLTTHCIVRSPPGSTGFVDVTVTVRGLTSPATSGSKFFYIGPVILGVTPASASVGDTITIYGQHLEDSTGPISVDFGTMPTSQVSCAFAATGAGEECRVTVPPGSGTVDLRVTTAAGLTTPITSADRFTYSPVAITGISPALGAITGGTYVFLSGTELNCDSGQLQVYFGGVPAAQIVHYGGGACAAITPAVATTGPVHVTATFNGATSAPSAADVFTYVANPALYGITYSRITGEYSLSLDSLAGPAGATIALTSDNTAFMVPPATVTVPARASSVVVPLTFRTRDGSATLAAFFAGSSVRTLITHVCEPSPPGCPAGRTWDSTMCRCVPTGPLY
jgi:hypothetical protein